MNVDVDLFQPCTRRELEDVLNYLLSRQRDDRLRDLASAQRVPDALAGS